MFFDHAYLSCPIREELREHPYLFQPVWIVGLTIEDVSRADRELEPARLKTC
jgi:hypothetical protein